MKLGKRRASTSEDRTLIIKRVKSVYRDGGVASVLKAIVRRIGTPHARSFPVCKEIVSGGVGIEIGGPSPIFAQGGMIPIYPLVERVDSVNFASSTLWEGEIEEGASFNFSRGKAPGRQFIAEGADLHMIPDGDYDFVLSSHVLEHIANPLKAVAEWMRLLKPGGGLVLVLPHRDGTFDHRRPITTMQHLIEDFEMNMSEDDLTHLPEVLELHDLSKDPGVTEAIFRERAGRNPLARTVHHHVFDTRLAMAVVNKSGLELLAIEPLMPYHIIVIARKSEQSSLEQPPNMDVSEVLRRSPFQTDRQ